MTTQPTFTCATCDASILHHPTFHVGLAFCCAGCAADGPCMCSYDVEVPEAIKAPIPAVVIAHAPRLGAPSIPRPATPTRSPERTPASPGGTAPTLAAARR